MTNESPNSNQEETTAFYYLEKAGTLSCVKTNETISNGSDLIISKKCSTPPAKDTDIVLIETPKHSLQHFFTAPQQ